MGHSLKTASSVQTPERFFLYTPAAQKRVFHRGHNIWGTQLPLRPRIKTACNFTLYLPNCHGIQTTNDRSFRNSFGRKLNNNNNNQKNSHPVRLSSIISLIDVYGFGLALFEAPAHPEIISAADQVPTGSTLHPSARHDQPPIKFVAAQFFPPSC